jgi:AraC-like DNA-binding protein
MQYLAHWRIQLASRPLRQTHQKVAAVAPQVGYESEPPGYARGSRGRI